MPGFYCYRKKSGGETFQPISPQTLKEPDLTGSSVYLRPVQATGTVVVIGGRQTGKRHLDRLDLPGV